jgi:hypothetical protein
MSEQVMISTQMQTILGALMRPAVQYNSAANLNYYGVLFFENPDTKAICAAAASSQFAVIIEGISEQPKGEFFSFVQNEWTKNQYSLTPERIYKTLQDIVSHSSGKFIVPIPNFINHLNKLTDTEKKSARVIMSPDLLEEGEILMKFENDNGQLVFRHKLLPKPCLIGTESIIPNNVVKPNMVYKAIITNETSDSFIVNVVSPYSKIKIGLHYSPEGFAPSDIDSINKMRNMAEGWILRINEINPAQNFNMAPIHLRCTSLYDLVKCMALSSSPFMEIYASVDSNAPILMKNIKNDPKDLDITIMQATLNPFYGPQRS